MTPIAACLVADDDFPEELALDEVIQSCHRIVEGIDTVDDGPNLMLRQYPVQILQIATASGRDALECGVRCKHCHEVDAALHARQNADERYVAAIPVPRQQGANTSRWR